jgi:hypothetical protein
MEQQQSNQIIRNQIKSNYPKSNQIKIKSNQNQIKSKSNRNQVHQRHEAAPAPHPM